MQNVVCTLGAALAFTACGALPPATPSCPALTPTLLQLSVARTASGAATLRSLGGTAFALRLDGQGADAATFDLGRPIHLARAELQARLEPIDARWSSEIVLTSSTTGALLLHAWNTAKPPQQESPLFVSYQPLEACAPASRCDDILPERLFVSSTTAISREALPGQDVQLESHLIVNGDSYRQTEHALCSDLLDHYAGAIIADSVR